ncbi:hypothetical protein GX50_03417 [[Emmonsia] crescens]|uniref:Peptidase A1 domain-containing protein n=1 Tax=[Emmonsia] crescens TaxID=73230 RepID=A0A2B7ZKA5_9EURO|nr:hypothetical protein GX50_03417 [Emmonsia crescens]
MQPGLFCAALPVALCLWCLSSSLASASASFAVPWSSKTYGPDGPWHAVKVQVGGNDPKIRYHLQSDEVDLFPGGTYSSYILSPKACDPFPKGECGNGGVWLPKAKSSFPIQWLESFDSAAINQTSGGCPLNIQAMTINGQTVWNSSLVTVSNVTITMPNGKTRGPLLGRLSLGGSKTIQEFSKSSTEVGTYDAHMFPGGLYDQGIIPSYSYALHIGSAAHKYGGSLVFGGYDKGRIIGPYTTFPDKSIALFDIGIGVETGASPFPFESKNGLLLSNTSTQEALLVMPDPTVPYLHLPSNTCEEIAKHLPVAMDPGTGYYLWNTDDPLFERITTSPSYLSFTFPPASGGTEKVVIKVPFALLNLTLESPIITGSPRPYFPCSSFTPLSGDTYRLGRAFLQAGFLGRNWFTEVSWLGQAPGPGLRGQGLGEQLQDIPDRATTIEYFDPNGQFAHSWSDHWKPLEKNEGKNETAVSKENKRPSTVPDNGLSNITKIGIGVGCGIGAILIVAVLSFVFRRRRPGGEVMGGELKFQERFASERLARVVEYPLELQGHSNSIRQADAVPPIFEMGSSTPKIRQYS